jgi:hypothetical protein
MAEGSFSSINYQLSTINYQLSTIQEAKGGSFARIAWAVHWRRRSDIAAPWGESFALSLGDACAGRRGRRRARGSFARFIGGSLAAAIGYRRSLGMGRDVPAP